MATNAACLNARALISRLGLMGHSILTFAIFYNNSPNLMYWLIIIPLLLQLIDITFRKEFGYFWLTGFIYIGSLVPIIWLVEIELLEQRIYKLEHLNATAIEVITHSHKKSVSSLNVTKPFLNLLSISNEAVAKKLCEIGLLVGIIFVRAIMPRGNISHEKLSSMLLTFVGNSADIIGLFDTFLDRSIMYIRSVVYVVLGIFTWSVIQFTFIPSDIKQQKKEESNGDIKEHGKRSKTEFDVVANGDQIGSVKHFSSVFSSVSKHCTVDVCESLVFLLMHDGPYLVLRLYLIVYYQVYGEMHIFFTIKNSMVVVLHLYRLIVLWCNEEECELEDDRKSSV